MSAGVAGLYVHFPYCTHRCTYCDFPLQTPRRVPQRAFTDALLAELALRAPAGPAPTLYVGGGTPSLWALPELARFVCAARDGIGVADGAEVTLEANPGQVDDAWVAGVLALGVNRVSLGVQALRDDHLAALTRRHSADDAIAAVRRLAGAGFRSYSVDLIFGVPGQTLASWREDLARAVALGAPHLSVYGLTVEPGTLLARDVARGAVTVPDSDLQADLFEAAREALCSAGYEHYEVSNYALPGHAAVHNHRYWDGLPYVGLGPGAHGWDGRARWKNHPRVKRWQEALAQGALPEVERAEPDAATAAFERVMTGLRRLDTGVDLAPDEARFLPAARAQAALGRIELAGTRIRLTDAGLLLMDDVLLALLG
ncbi:MAG: radical SAM family heme chaperone HemW [Myxococcales bacterium]|nr:radical SAM family heme chaperone HemW [Myxococcales bacterium]MCB9734505.1 radical SAM family heme chaperone HemW [Deltaproteobacteria bacterium]